jgi:S1-C subfamily serine protease
MNMAASDLSVLFHSMKPILSPLRILCSIAWLALVAATHAGAAEAAAVPEVPLDVRRDATVAAVERVLPAVVNIASRTWVNEETPYERMRRQFYGYQRQPEARYSRGSGVVISEDGYVLTNVHVVRGADDIWVQFNDDPEPIPAERVALSEDKDVALLKLNPKQPRKFKAVKFAKDDDLLLGETVVALGNPFGLGGSVARGILSSKSRRAADSVSVGEKLDIADWLQTDAAINPGNSGGPLVNLHGELIGLNVAVLRPDIGAQGIGFAIPIKRVNQALSETLVGESVDRFWFGARLKPGLRPLTVQSVQPGSPAATAGLKSGDAILAVNDNPPGSVIDFNRALTTAGTTRELRLTVRRSGETQDLKLRLIEERAHFNNDLLRRRLGLTLREAEGGFVVQTVDRDGPAAVVKLQPGHFIAALDGQRVTDLVAAAKLVAAKARGDEVEFSVIVLERSGLGIRRYSGEVTLKVR